MILHLIYDCHGNVFSPPSYQLDRSTVIFYKVGLTWPMGAPRIFSRVGQIHKRSQDFL